MCIPNASLNALFDIILYHLYVALFISVNLEPTQILPDYTSVHGDETSPFLGTLFAFIKFK